MKSLNPAGRRAWLPCALLLLGSTLSGCGGGGGATGPASPVTPQPATITLSGTLLDSGGAPLVGYKVLYTPAATAHTRRAADTNGTISAVTDTHGFYTLSIPAAQATATATLTVFDTAGVQVQSQAITLDPSQPVQAPVTIVTTPVTPTDPTPPPPPAAPTL